MNFLAHLYLSCENDSLLLGNYIADFIRNKELVQYEKSVQQGVKLHRNIDHYTDNHPIVRQGTKRLQLRHRKYAAVIIDVFYDYFLANNWNLYSGQSLQDFATEVYGILTTHLDKMPPKLANRTEKMIQHNWLLGYANKKGIAYTFEGLKKRVSQPILFEKVMLSLEEQEAMLNEEFKQFFPEVIKAVDEWCMC